MIIEITGTDVGFICYMIGGDVWFTQFIEQYQAGREYQFLCIAFGHVSDLRAQFLVKGFMQGLHASPYHGFSVEFSEHRRYEHGDDPKDIDWLVYAKTDRYYVKKFEAETNMRVYLAVDTSKSMGFSGGSGPSKLVYSSYLAAALAYLVHKQQDLTGLVTFNDNIAELIPPGSSNSHLRKIISKLTDIKEEGTTNIGLSLKNLLEKLKRRCLVIIISDFLDDPESILKIA